MKTQPSSPTFSTGSGVPGVVETIAVYPVRRAPDEPLSRIQAGLEDMGFSVDTGEHVDLAARRGLDRVFVGLGPHEEGTVARWKAKSLVPGRSHEIQQRVRRILSEVLGEPTRFLDPGGEGS